MSQGRSSNGRFAKGNDIGKSTRFDKDNTDAVKYRKEYADELVAYFDKPATRIEYEEKYDSNGNVTAKRPIVVPNDYPTFESFAQKIGVCLTTLENWAKRYRRFGDAYERARELQRNNLIINALGGRYNPLFAKFVAMNCHGMSDKVTEKHELEDGFEVNINVKESPGS